jgi:hypothetical protein
MTILLFTCLLKGLKEESYVLGEAPTFSCKILSSKTTVLQCKSMIADTTQPEWLQGFMALRGT